MAYQVALTDSAMADANQIFEWVVQRAAIRGQEWFDELIDCLYSLEAQTLAQSHANPPPQSGRFVVYSLANGEEHIAFSSKLTSAKGKF